MYSTCTMRCMRLASECSDCVERRDSPLDTLNQRKTLVRLEPNLEDRAEPVCVELHLQHGEA